VLFHNLGPATWKAQQSVTALDYQIRTKNIYYS